MKTNLFMTLALLVFFGCTKPGPAPMTPQEQEIAKKEIAEAVNIVFQNLEKMDAEVLFQSYVNSPDFILFTTEGSMADYQAAKNHHIEWFKSLSAMKVTTVKEEIRFLPGNVAICAWLGKFEMTLKMGGQPTIDFGITFVFNKIDNRWKVIYQHTTALPPVQEKPNS